MTNEEAIKMLKSKMDGHTDTSYEWAETVRMAIKALEQQPYEDCISREQAIKQCGFGMTSLLIADCLRRLPSVQPTRPAGKWKRIHPQGIYECSECGINLMTGDIECYEYCHGCGAKMEVTENADSN